MSVPPIRGDVRLALVAERDTEQDFGDGAVLIGRPVRVNACYRADDPYAITLQIATSYADSGLVSVGWTEWVFARELLAEGLATGAAGPEEGDVYIAADSQVPGRVSIVLSPPDGVARFAFRRADLQHLLEKSEAVVARGRESERIDWDAAIAAGLRGGGR